MIGIQNSEFRIKNSRGFTIIELIVVFAVIAVLSSIGIASFLTYNKNQALQSAVSDLSTTLSLAKSRALSQVKPSQCTTQTLDGYKVVITISSQSYELDAVCSGFTYPILQKSLAKDIKFDATKTAPTSFFFPTIVNGVSGQGTITLTAYGLSKTITVDKVGTIR